MKYKLSEVAYYSKEKIKTDELSPENYLSTENMLPEFGGITTASSLPTISTVTKYQPGDILLSNIRPYFKKLYYSISEGGCSNDVLCLCAKDNINKAFLYYSLKNDDFFKYVMATAKGTKMPRGDKSAIMDYELKVPNLETQQKIVRILSALDQKIELINCENCTIENTLQSYFNNWIDNMKPIATVGLDEIAKYTNGLAMQKFRPGDNDLGLPVVKIKEMNSGISKDTERCTSELKEEYTVFPGDVLFAWSGTLCMKIWDGEVAGLNQHIFKVTSDEYPKWFYYFWTKKHLERFINIAKGKATTMGHIQRKELSLSKVLIPNEHELKKQDGLFKPLLEKIISNNSQRQSLIHLRDTILPKLMSGEINLDKVMTDE